MIPTSILDEAFPGYLSAGFSRQMLEKLILRDNPNIELLIQEQKEREKAVNKFKFVKKQ
jgi:hypothetical protein